MQNKCVDFVLHNTHSPLWLWKLGLLKQRLSFQQADDPWKFKSECVNGLGVSSLSWNEGKTDLLAVGYGSSSFGSTRKGCCLYGRPKIQEANRWYPHALGYPRWLLLGDKTYLQSAFMIRGLTTQYMPAKPPTKHQCNSALQAPRPCLSALDIA